MSAMTDQQWQEFLLGSVRTVAEATRAPGSDLAPMAFLEDAGGSVQIVVLDGVRAQDVPLVLVDLIARFRCRRVGRVAPAWVATPKPGDVAGPGFAEGSPVRGECVIVTLHSPERALGWEAALVRSEDGVPTLHAFRQTDDDPEGWQIEPVQVALRAVAREAGAGWTGEAGL